MLLCVGTRVRLTAKVDADLGSVQEQKATVVDFVFHDMDAPRYTATPAGAVFQPTLMPAAIVLKVDGFEGGVLPSSSNASAGHMPRELAASIFMRA